MIKKGIVSLLIVALVISTVLFGTMTASADVVNNSRPIMVKGNQVVYVDDQNTAVRLTGVNISGAYWTGTPSVEKLDRSIAYAIDEWKCNIVRIDVSVNGWYGDYEYVHDGGEGYRNYIDSVIQIASEKGAYVILDLHHFGSFNNPLYLTFWQDAAVRYANNPTVLFGIFNEPHGINWEVWRNGNGADITGHQQVVEMIRDLGAKNIIIAGGIDYSYDLRGIVGEAGDGVNYALVDQGSNNDATKAGNGIVYDTHIYPWKGTSSAWDDAIGTVRKVHPVIVGECGWQNGLNGYTYEEGSDRYYDKWVPEFLAWTDDTQEYGAAIHYTAYTLHTSSAPCLIEKVDENGNDFGSADYAYTPTEYWGVYVKDHLAQTAENRETDISVPVSIAVRDAVTEYAVHEEFHRTLGCIDVTYSNGNVVSIPLTLEDIVIEGFDSGSTGTKTLNVSYLGLTTTYDIEVVDLEPWAVTATFDSGADMSFANSAFNSRWQGQTSSDTIKKVGASGKGLTGSNAIGFEYNRAGTWSGVQEGVVPAAWDWGRIKYISFYAKLETATTEQGNFTISLVGTSANCKYTATSDWQFYSFDLSGYDLSSGNKLRFYADTKNSSGTVLIENLTISNYEIFERPFISTKPYSGWFESEEGIITGVVRYITLLENKCNTISQYGTYIIPMSIFESDYDAKTVVETYNGTLNVNESFQADILDIPEKDFDKPICGISYVLYGDNIYEANVVFTDVNEDVFLGTDYETMKVEEGVRRQQ